ncbi:CotH kinase family protein [Lysinibacillus sp. FJAT-14745]|uniref:CotH kinase family protein n=1 Tax=Lysinibacillus sp. FJAT-14745 TaxID=1704289 RepID=UPI001F21749D|nr:CotH kinase family protein [Lysinibacillus sp. FJAT-14745]
MEARPLLNALLFNEEYRAKYEGYLEVIATNYLTEDNVQNITKKLALLLTTYVEVDPTKILYNRTVYRSGNLFLSSCLGNLSLFLNLTEEVVKK